MILFSWFLTAEEKLSLYIYVLIPMYQHGGELHTKPLTQKTRHHLSTWKRRTRKITPQTKKSDFSPTSFGMMSSTANTGWIVSYRRATRRVVSQPKCRSCTSVHNLNHLFTCPANPIHLEPTDLWTIFIDAIAFLDLEEDWMSPKTLRIQPHQREDNEQ